MGEMFPLLASSKLPCQDGQAAGMGAASWSCEAPSEAREQGPESYNLEDLGSPSDLRELPGFPSPAARRGGRVPQVRPGGSTGTEAVNLGCCNPVRLGSFVMQQLKANTQATRDSSQLQSQRRTPSSVAGGLRKRDGEKLDPGVQEACFSIQN